MIIRYGSSKIIKTATTLAGLSYGNAGIVRTAANTLEGLELNPDDHIYLRNRAVSALELHGPNQNWDAFEHNELEKSYSSFIEKDISVDHISTSRIGTVLDSQFIPSPEVRASFGMPLMPLDHTVTALCKRCKEKDTWSRVFGYAEKNNLVRGSDQKMIVEAVAKHWANSGWIENIWAVEKEAAEAHTPNMIKGILSGEISDSSMGTEIQQAICSVCGHIATGELPENEDFCDDIRLHKGELISLNGVDVVPYEINRECEFFEDSLILPHRFGGQAGGEGADMDAKLLEVLASRASRAEKAEEKKAYIENMPNPSPATSKSPDVYVMIGDTPDVVEKNRDEFNEEKKEFIKEHIEEESAPGEYPPGTIIHIIYEDEEADASVVDEYEGGTLTVAIDGIDEPVDINIDAVQEVIEYPEEMGYDTKMDISDVPETERHPEKRSA